MKLGYLCLVQGVYKYLEEDFHFNFNHLCLERMSIEEDKKFQGGQGELEHLSSLVGKDEKEAERKELKKVN